MCVCVCVAVHADVIVSMFQADMVEHTSSTSSIHVFRLIRLQRSSRSPPLGGCSSSDGKLIVNTEGARRGGRRGEDS